MGPSAGESAKPDQPNENAHGPNQRRGPDETTMAGTHATAAAAVAVTESAAALGRRRYSHMILASSVLAVIALIAALYLARGFFVPLLIGILASYTLRPVVDWLEAHFVPRAVGAAMALVILSGGLTWVGYSLADDAAAMIEKLPEAARKLRRTLTEARTGGAGGNSPLQNMQEAANEIQAAAADASQTKGARPSVVRAPESSLWLRDYALAQSALLITVVAQAPMVLLLAYFLLASGVHFRRKLVQLVGPSLSRKKDAVRILEEIDVQVQRYLLTTFMSNAMVAVATWLAFEALGVEQAAVWGLAAGILHFIPYLGTTLIVLGSGITAFMQFGSVLEALAVAAAALVVAGTIGHVFMTWLQSRIARVNAAVLFIALLFFGWLWGIWGLLLGAPLLAIIKVICDRVESLHPLGELLGR